MNLSIELKTRIYEHIGQVRNHLGAFAVDEQREILESIETHIHDALESRSEGEPTMDLLEAIVAELDPPESYGPRNFNLEQQSGKISPSSSKGLLKGCAVVVLACIAMSVVAIIFWNKSTTTGKVVRPDQTDAAEPEPSPEPAPTKEKPPARSPIIGHWTSIDFVPEIKAFDPDKRTWQGALELKELIFLPDGSTSKPWWTWKGNQLFHSGDQSQASFSIVTIARQEYLFLEWLSGDVLTGDKKPSYYVFIRGSYIDPSEPKIITEGVGWGVVRLGASAAEVTEYLGTPNPWSIPTRPWLRWTRWPFECTVNKDHHVIGITFHGEFNGQTSKGIKMGSSEQEVLDAYGQPSDMSIGENRGRNTETMWWRNLGLRITIIDGKVYQIDISKPQ